MSSDAWEEIQAIKSKRNSLREKLEKRRKARKDILDSSLGPSVTPLSNSFESATTAQQERVKNEETEETDLVKSDPALEKELLKILNEATLQLPVSSTELVVSLKTASHVTVCNLLQKFATQKLIAVKDGVKDGKSIVDVIIVEHTKINAMVTEEVVVDVTAVIKQDCLKRKGDESPDVRVMEDEEKKKKEKRDPRATDIFVSLKLCNSQKQMFNLKILNVYVGVVFTFYPIVS